MSSVALYLRSLRRYRTARLCASCAVVSFVVTSVIAWVWP